MKTKKYVGRPQWKMKKAFESIRTGGSTVVRVDEDGKEGPLSLRLDLFNHSPSGFSWGYGGSGPAQLALGILCDYFSMQSDEYIEKLRVKFKQDELENPPTVEEINWKDWYAVHLHQTFKFKVIANLPKEDGFNLTIDQVSEAIENIVEK